MYDFYSLNPDQGKTSNSTSDSISIAINEVLTNNTFYKLFEDYYYNQNEETENALGNHLNSINYLIAFIPSDDMQPDAKNITITKMDDINLLISTTEEREVFLPVFTDSREFTRWYDDKAYTLNVPAKWLWRFVLTQKNFSGIVFNPGSIGWDITLEHIQSLLDDLAK